MALTDAELKKLLLDLSYVSEEDIKKAEAQAKAHSTSLKETMKEMDLLSQDLYESAIAEFYHLPYYDLGHNPPAAEVVTKLPEDIATSYNALAVSEEKGTLTIATSDPSLA